ncbi:MucB/RseB C-terminal domain-containing protein [Orbus sturtevantii]|uniref:MucB/RseB C-terminal domain-containing protein n=1 Tax=Orbus sturtevantii TaxID=3074109 RepID=UPI00370DE04A
MIANLFKAEFIVLPLKWMKAVLIITLCCFSFYVFSEPLNTSVGDDLDSMPRQSAIDESVITLLNNMKNTVLNTDYKIHFVQQESNGYSNTFQYRHLGANNENYANLLYLEGAPKEIILHNDTVSYFQPESESFSLAIKHIIEAFPDIIYSDFNKLSEYYDFVLLGKSRTANRNSQLVRIIPKDKDRYNYVLWIDDDSNLPLRIDLLDLNSKIIKQIKVLDVNFDFDKHAFKNYIEDRDYPIIIPINKEKQQVNSWQIDFLPKGFSEISAYNFDFDKTNIDTGIFSDGVFSFSVNVSKSPLANKLANVIAQGERTIYSANINHMNIVIIGDLPPETIEHIANSINIKLP